MNLSEEDNYKKTFVIKMAVCSENENQLLKFLSIALDNEETSFSFDNLIPVGSNRQRYLHSLVRWRISNWGVAYDCDYVVKDVKHVDKLFDRSELYKYSEYLQYTTLLNIPVQLFLQLSSAFSDLKFIMIFIRNDLTLCGKLTIENDQIISRTLIEGENPQMIQLFQYMYDNNYPNLIYGGLDL